MKIARLPSIDRKIMVVDDIPLQPASRDIWDKKYRLKAKNGRVVDESVDGTYRRVAKALSEVEETPEKREQWYEKFLWALRHGAIPAGRIISNAGAWEHKPATSTINCTVSGTIQDSMDDILGKVHEAGLTLKSGCVAPGTKVYTEHGLVSADEAVRDKHERILCYDLESGKFEMRRIEQHLTTHVPRAENIELVSNNVSLKTSVKHPVLIYRGGKFAYVSAAEVREDDALVHYRLPWMAQAKSTLHAWFAGAHLGDGSAYEKKKLYSSSRQAWAMRAKAAGKRLVFKIRAAERQVIERYAEFFQKFCGAQAKVVNSATHNGTLVWDYCVASFDASRAADFIDHQVGKKTAKLHIPEWIGRHPEKHFLPFLAGLIDTDGTVTKERGSVTIAMQSHDFAAQLKSLLGLFGVNAGITLRKPRSHQYQGQVIHDNGGAVLKISDSAFLAVVARFMADDGKRRRIEMYASAAGQYDRYVMTAALREALCKEVSALSHKEKQTQGFYHGYHQNPVVSRIWLDRWARRFPHLAHLIDFVRTLRPVDAINRQLDLSETFYDFTVEKHNNYLAGNHGMMVIHNCGIGYEFSTLRPRGAYVSGAGAYTSGPLSFMDIYDKMCFTVSSAGGRRGAQMATFDVGHPDVMEFIRAKREAGRLRQFNLSLLITQEFMEAVRNDSDWPLAFPLREKEVLEDGIDLDDPARIIWREWPAREGLVVNESGQVACRIYKVIRARRLWDVIMASTYDYAEPGFILIDKVNEMNNNWWCEVIRATNPCVTADTWVHTSNGPRQVRELIGEEFLVRVDGEDHATTQGGFFFTARKQVVRLETKHGFSLKLTADHQVLRATGFAHGDPTTQWCAASDLKPGDRILLNNHRASPEWAGRFGDLDGFLIGKNLVETNWTGFIDDELSSMATGTSGGRRFRKVKPISDDACISLEDLASELDLKYGVPAITPAIERASSHFYKGFLRGIFEKHAELVSTKASECRIELELPTCALLQGIQRMLLRLGVCSNICANQLVISGDNLKQFERNIGFDSDEKRNALYDAIERFATDLFHERFTAVVQTVVEDDVEDVYDVCVPGINAFDANGLHAHNCGEQPLPPYGSCLLGSVNLTKFVCNPFTDQAGFDWDKFREVVAVFTRMLDNVVEINGLPLEHQRHEILTKRRHGMGYLGLGSTLTMLGMKYGESDSLAFTEKVTRELALAGWRTALELAREKGPAPVLEEEFTVTEEMLKKRPEMQDDGYRVGDTVKGRVLHARYSRYMQQVAEADPELVKELADVGARFTHHSSIAPTGTISLSLANNASNGIEPSFAHHYCRNVIREGRKSKEKVDVFSFELLVYRELVNPRAMPFSDDPEEQLPDYFITADHVTPEQHVDIQAAAQKWIDSSISKTANIPTDFPYEDFKNIYLYAYEQGLKGCTTFRFNPEAFQGVLVNERDLANTVYRFILEDGSRLEVKGNEEIEYDGEVHNAANLFDALKEGYYGKF